MNTEDMIAVLTDMAKKAVPLLAFGPIGSIIARATLDAMKAATETMGLTQEQLVVVDAERIALEQAVNQRAKDVAARLQG